MKWIVANIETNETLRVVDLNDEEVSLIAQCAVEWDYPDLPTGPAMPFELMR